MARLNIEECWWTDLRRTALVKKLGCEDKADICAIRAWKTAQEFWKKDKGLVPLYLFKLLENHAYLVECGLADVRGEFVYIRGSSSYLDWIRESRERAKKAGKASAEARKKKNGSAQPFSSSGQNPRKSTELDRTSTEHLFGGDRTKPNITEPSVSGSSSLNQTTSNEVVTEVAEDPPHTATEPPDLKALSPPLNKPAAQKRSGPSRFKAQSLDQVLQVLGEVKRAQWLQLYGDDELRQAWLSRELQKAWNYYADNGSKAPKSKRGWSQALSSWLERSWQYQSRGSPPAQRLVHSQSEAKSNHYRSVAEKIERGEV